MTIADWSFEWFGTMRCFCSECKGNRKFAGIWISSLDGSAQQDLCVKEKTCTVGLSAFSLRLEVCNTSLSCRHSCAFRKMENVSHNKYPSGCCITRVREGRGEAGSARERGGGGIRARPAKKYYVPSLFFLTIAVCL